MNIDHDLKLEKKGSILKSQTLLSKLAKQNGSKRLFFKFCLIVQMVSKSVLKLGAFFREKMESMEQLDLKDLWALLAFLEKLAPMDLLVCKDLRAVQELQVNPGLLAHPDSQGKR